MAEATARVADRRPHHLRAIDAPARRAKFAQTSDAVARILGPHRSAAHLYGYLASAWYEFASADALRAIAAKTGRTKTPGDWVSISYAEFMAFMGTRAKASVIRWIRTLSEEIHECPWSKCADEHPLVVVHRVGQNKPNEYRRWRCGEDVLFVRPRVVSRALSAAAHARIAAGRLPSGESAPAIELRKSQNETSEIAFEFAGKSYNETSDDEGAGAPEVSKRDFRISANKAPGSLISEPPEVSKSYRRESQNETSLRVKSSKSLRATADDAPRPVAAVERIDETDAVACEIVDAVLELAQRIEPTYSDAQAWAVCRKLAASLIAHVGGDAETARPLLLLAIADRRLQKADNPIGLLIRGICGNANSIGRFLIPATQPPRFAPTAAIVATRPPDDDDIETRRRESEENRRLDERAEAHIDSLGEPEVEKLRVALRVHLKTKFGSFNPRQPIARPMLVNFVKHQIREGLI